MPRPKRENAEVAPLDNTITQTTAHQNRFYREGPKAK